MTIHSSSSNNWGLSLYYVIGTVLVLCNRGKNLKKKKERYVSCLPEAHTRAEEIRLSKHTRKYIITNFYNCPKGQVPEFHERQSYEGPDLEREICKAEGPGIRSAAAQLTPTFLGRASRQGSLK